MTRNELTLGWLQLFQCTGVNGCDAGDDGGKDGVDGDDNCCDDENDDDNDDDNDDYNDDDDDDDDDRSCRYQEGEYLIDIGRRSCRYHEGEYLIDIGRGVLTRVASLRPFPRALLICIEDRVNVFLGLSVIFLVTVR